MDARALEQIIVEEIRKALASGPSSSQPGENSYLDPGMIAEGCSPQGCRTRTDAPPAPKPKETDTLPAHEGPSALLLFSGVREPWLPLLEALSQWREEGISMDAILCADCHAYPVANLQRAGVRVLSPLPPMVEQLATTDTPYSAIVIPSISRTCAAKTALGITDVPLLKMLYAGLARGIPTYASTEGMSPSACPSLGNGIPGVQDVLDQHRRQLGTMGIQLAPLPKTLEAAFTRIKNRADSDSNLIVDLITEEVAASLKGPVIKVARGGLVTPLARESLARRGIDIQIVPQS